MKINEYISRPKADVVTQEGQAAKPKPEANQAQVQSSGDRVQLSEKSKEIARARELVNSAPDVRMDKVEEMKAKIESGTYDVSAEKVADKLVKGHLSETV
jgi:negative regulator of flagellin synthesis FlgM